MASKKSGNRSSSQKKSMPHTASGRSSHRSSRKYGPSAGKEVETEMHEMKRGKLKSGRSGKKVTNPRQAIAIGLSKARKKGEKVPKKTT